MAAPLGASSEGLMAPMKVEGARMVVFSGKMLRASWAILGVWEVPPAKITCSGVRMWLREKQWIERNEPRQCPRHPDQPS